MPTAFGVLRMHHVISCHFCVATLGGGCFTFSTLQDLVLVRLACLGRVQVGRGWLQLSFGHERVGSWKARSCAECGYLSVLECGQHSTIISYYVSLLVGKYVLSLRWISRHAASGFEKHYAFHRRIRRDMNRCGWLGWSWGRENDRPWRIIFLPTASRKLIYADCSFCAACWHEGHTSWRGPEHQHCNSSKKAQQRLWVRFWSVCIAHTRSKPSTWSFCQIAWQMQRPDLGVISPKMWAVDWPSFSHGCPSEFLSVIALDGIAKLEALKGDW